ncbi:MAG: TerB family tellurite resistance protein [Planctomycetota bacterium]
MPAAVVPAAALASTSNQENIPVAEIVDSQDIDEAWQHVGELDPQHQRYARQLIDEMDPAIVEAAREMFSARAIIFSLLLDQRADVRGHQIESIRSVCEKPLLTEAARLWRMMKQLPDAARLPLLDLTLPALRSMSKGQYTRFMQIIESLVRADKQVRLFEWMLFRVLQRHLSPQFQGVRSPVVKYYGLKRLAPQISVLLSAVAYASAEEEDLKAGRSQALIQQSISASAKNLAELVAGVQLRPADQCGLREIQASLETLSTAAPRLRGRVVDACAEAVLADGKVTVQEAELLRGIADLLDCPIPPII